MPVVGDNKSWRKQQLLVKRQRRSIVGDTAGREAELRTLHLKVWKTGLFVEIFQPWNDLFSEGWRVGVAVSDGGTVV